MPDTPKLIPDLCNADLCETDELHKYARHMLHADEFEEGHQGWAGRGES